MSNLLHLLRDRAENRADRLTQERDALRARNAEQAATIVRLRNTIAVYEAEHAAELHTQRCIVDAAWQPLGHKGGRA